MPPSTLSVSEDLKQAVAAHRGERRDEAERLYRAILAREPANFDALHFLGVLLHAKGANEEAAALIARAVAVDPTFAPAHLALGETLVALQHYEAALECYDKALALRPIDSQALVNRGNVLWALGRREEASQSFVRALAIAPNDADAWNNLGIAFRQMDRFEDALASFDEALRLKPDGREIAGNRASALVAAIAGRRFDAALASHERALARQPREPSLHNDRGLVLGVMGRSAEALDAYDRALAIRPDFIPALQNRGNALVAAGQWAQAAETFEQLLRIEPHADYALGNLVYARLHLCDWRDFGANVAQIERDVAEGKQAVLPFPFLAMSDQPLLQRCCTEEYARRVFPSAPHPIWQGEQYRHDKIRVVYLSGDFHEHATSFLAAQLFERHDRTRFDVAGVSFGPETQGPMRERLKRGFDRFLDLRNESDRAIAQQLRAMEADIAVDLKGLSAGARPGIFAFRAAPVQVNYLAYPATMGAPYIDYILADRTIAPPAAEAAYAEKIVRLPETYQPNDRSRAIAAHGPTRREAGLPADAFVFCSFNNNYKITPPIFAVWMRLLSTIEGSVLWLLEGSDATAANLRRATAEAGVAPERLVFAPRLPLAEHLARHRLADLFLDTFPCNAHTTASDALWAGLPVLTLVGHTFAARVAASLNEAAGMSALNTASLDAYEELALRLARDSAHLASLRTQLARRRDTCALFDIDRLARHLEAAYIAMNDRAQRGETPAGFDVALQE